MDKEMREKMYDNGKIKMKPQNDEHKLFAHKILYLHE